MRHSFLLIITAVLFASVGLNSAWAATLKVSLTAVGVSRADLMAAVSLKPDAAADANDRTRSLRVPGEASFDVSLGQWLLSIQAPGYLSTSRSVVVANANETNVHIALVPATKVDGTIKAGKGESAIDALTLSYRFVNLPSEGALEAGTIDCSVSKSGFECHAPTGVLDYNLHAPGRASYYRWGETLVAGKTTHLGPIALVPGASLVGRVIADRAVKLGVTPIEIVLAPRGFAAAGALADRQKLHERRTKANKKGFFQFDGLPPGNYDVRAQSGDLISHSVEVSIVQTFEAELRNPLVLAPRKRLRVSISPPLDPSGNAWTVEFSALNRLANYRSLVKKTQADMAGSWAAPDLVPGEYLINVRQEPQASWFSKIVEVSDDDEILIEVGQTKVSGRVSRAGVPVQAILWFGGDRSSVSVPVRTDSNGDYSAVLPTVENDTWAEIDVVAENPPLRRALHDIKLSTRSDSQEGFLLDIDLPDRGIFGQVTDGASVVEGAQVFLARDDLKRVIDVMSDQNGNYGFDGLEPGGYSVRAIWGDRRSKSVQVDLTESDKGEVVDLRMEDQGELPGRLVSSGRPIGAGRVWALPPDRMAGIVAPTATAVDGTFVLHVPTDATYAALVASAPGFGLSFGRYALPATSVELQITADAAVLEIEARDFEGQRARGLLPVLVHRGTYLPVGLAAAFSGTAEVSQVDGAQKTRVAVEPGEYSVCFARQVAGPNETLLQPEKCATGAAMPGSVLTLSVKAPEASQGAP
ncbi:MAG: carboxypeptidase regulatory-like domain-containing protein [Thermoanaerobaculia bacterium]